MHRIFGRIIRPVLIFGIRPDTGFALPDIRPDTGFLKIFVYLAEYPAKVKR
jgi:hypothetical protein